MSQKYDFDALIDRRRTNSLKWDVEENELPMWVADMDFHTAPVVRKALEGRVAHGIFGYADVTDAWYDAYTGWWEKRHHFKMEKDWLVFCTGVVPALSSAVRKLTTPGEKVLIQTPVYHIFFNSIVNNGRFPLESPLTYDGVSYGIDFAALKRDMADPQVSLMILCNPHNPVGKLWSREELARIGELAEQHHVVVVSDEIHCDLTDPGKEYVPFLSASDTCKKVGIACMAPTKAFNLAGLSTAAAAVPDPALRHRMWRGLNTDECGEPNAFAVEAAAAAFTEEGADWLDALRAYIYTNKCLVTNFVKEQLPSVFLLPSEATYLLWLDCGRITDSASDLAAFIRSKTGLYLSDGSPFGGNGGQFLRLNIACPKSRVEDGLCRLKDGILAYKKDAR